MARVLMFDKEVLSCLKRFTMKNFIKDNGLSIVLFLLFAFSIIGQAITGHQEHNEETVEMGGQPEPFGKYLTSGHFLQATFENWESEFLQMALFLIFTMFLVQRGSAESKDPDKGEDVDKEPNPNKKDAPWPVKKGGWVRSLYEHSLCYTFSLLFLLSFWIHWQGSLKDFNEEQVLKRLPTESGTQYLGNPRFWFESFQNWQSEFLSLFAMVVLSIFLREKGSPQSKPVDAPDSQTGK
jgi:hypothetical protein